MEFADLNFTPLWTNGDTSAVIVVDKFTHLFDNSLPLVICAGDSFSHGHGSAGYHYSCYPGDLTSEENSLLATTTRVNKLAEYSKLISSTELSCNTVWGLERKGSWPNQLQIIRPDLQVLNLSIPGGSVERAVRLLVEWGLTVNQKFPNKKLTLVCGNSFHWRHEFLSVQGYGMFISSQLPNPGTEEILHDLCVNHWDEYIHTCLYFKELSWLVGVSRINGFNVQIVSYGSEEYITLTEIIDRYSSTLSGIWPGVTMVEPNEYGPDEKIHAYDGHYSALVYKNVAKKISCLI
jgi:hypothetical protein